MVTRSEDTSADRRAHTDPPLASGDVTAVSVTAVAALIALSDERDLWHLRVLAAWRDGYAAGHESMADQVNTAYIDGLLAYKRIQHDYVRALTGGTNRVDLWADQQARTWGPGGREHFADPRPGDYPGRAVAS